MIDNEGLLYKFNVALGDTLIIVNEVFTIPSIVADIDSLFIISINEKVKRIRLVDLNNPPIFEEYWLEGIGSSAGLLLSGFHAQPLTGAMYSSLCHWKDNSFVYSNPAFSFCYHTTVGTEESSEKNNMLQVIPSPVSDRSDIKITLDASGIYNLEIYDMYGKRIMNNRVQAESKISIHRSDFHPGMYIIVLMKDNKFIARTKFQVL